MNRDGSGLKAEAYKTRRSFQATIKKSINVRHCVRVIARCILVKSAKHGGKKPAKHKTKSTFCRCMS